MARGTASALALASLTATTSFAFTRTKTTPAAIHRGQRGIGGIERVEALHAEDGNKGGAMKRAYNDDALFNFHMMTQRQKIRDYSAMDSYVNTQSLWNLAWHDSFVRNGLSDLVPPLTDSLNVLVVGNRYRGPDGEIVVARDGPTMIADDRTAAATAIDPAKMLKTASASTVEEDGREVAASIDETESIQKSEDSSCSFLAAVLDDDSNNIRSGGDENDIASYDCIMDQGLIADLVASVDVNGGDKVKEDLARLLYEATRRIREMGVYVANTRPMSSETKEYLRTLGDVLGLQWEFDLDGISDENQSVSVARKFGLCPTIGWQTLARMLEE
eukprot:CAMPEP_0172550980 /NCGR_PEP_ID=MMETSP1067-20121228/34490_1 /TAXON_ID=265564 ORGANISM="Thalassiosira punctigera, Strain Tpunct2005C2" /NCGR_SAMPLE_ID=MMETSP1067 /ASSEMBLY_ACC=CAM_ASM_000444 /LENGTH=330 /DNA_ID=CAMNT_0013338687 /DNA_START=229 /DNA_END=1221 /DNA_ORIENTATION=-